MSSPANNETRVLTVGFIPLLVLAFLHSVTIGILFYLPRFVVQLGGSGTQAGALAALALVPLLPGPWTKWVEKRSALSLIAWGLALSSLSRWGIAQTTTLDVWLVIWSFIGGVGFAWCFVPMLRLAHDLAPVARRGRAVTWFVSAMQFGNAVGSYLGGHWVEANQYATMFGAATLILLLAAVPLLMLRRPILALPPHPVETRRLPLRESLRFTAPYLIVMLAVGMAFGIPLQFMPVHLAAVAKETSLSLSSAAFLSTSFLAILASRIVLAPLLDGRWRRVLYWSALFVLGAALLSLAGIRSNMALTVVALAYGLGYSLLFPIVTAQGLAHAPPEGRAAMSNNLTLGFELGTRGAALPAGMIADAWGFSVLFVALAVCVLVVVGSWGWKAMRASEA